MTNLDGCSFRRLYFVIVSGGSANFLVRFVLCNECCSFAVIIDESDVGSDALFTPLIAQLLPRTKIESEERSFLRIYFTFLCPLEFALSTYKYQIPTLSRLHNWRRKKKRKIVLPTELSTYYKPIRVVSSYSQKGYIYLCHNNP